LDNPRQGDAGICCAIDGLQREMNELRKKYRGSDGSETESRSPAGKQVH
jgi:hypothetical protein